MMLAIVIIEIIIITIDMNVMAVGKTRRRQSARVMSCIFELSRWCSCFPYYFLLHSSPV